MKTFKRFIATLILAISLSATVLAGSPDNTADVNDPSPAVNSNLSIGEKLLLEFLLTTF